MLFGSYTTLRTSPISHTRGCVVIQFYGTASYYVGSIGKADQSLFRVWGYCFLAGAISTSMGSLVNQIL